MNDFLTWCDERTAACQQRRKELAHGPLHSRGRLGGGRLQRLRLSGRDLIDPAAVEVAQPRIRRFPFIDADGIALIQPQHP